MSERLQLIIDEGLRLFPYQCTAGAVTIGIGRNLDGNPLTTDECMRMLLARPHIPVSNTELTNLRVLLLADFAQVGITEAEAHYLFENDLRRVDKDLNRSLPWLTDHPAEVRNILTNMCFQMGINGLLGFVNTLACIKYRKYKSAAERMKISKWAKQTPKRANRLIVRMNKV